MLVLWERDTTTAETLANTIDVDRETLSPLLKRLAAAGLVSGFHSESRLVRPLLFVQAWIVEGPRERPSVVQAVRSAAAGLRGE
jgi:MarR family transcriptional regulator, organic hydroperoxide resistance regulator